MANLLQRARQNRQSAVKSLAQRKIDNIFDVDFAVANEPKRDLPGFLRENVLMARPELREFHPENRVAA